MAFIVLNIYWFWTEYPFIVFYGIHITTWPSYWVSDNEYRGYLKYLTFHWYSITSLRPSKRESEYTYQVRYNKTCSNIVRQQKQPCYVLTISLSSLFLIGQYKGIYPSEILRESSPSSMFFALIWYLKKKQIHIWWPKPGLFISKTTRKHDINW